MPKVSVIIPVYKAEPYIERCARSLFEQTLDDLEFIFVDDCSPDRSIEVMERLLDEYPTRKSQVKVIHHEANQGVSAARQHGVDAATGEYIIHCDPDDWVELNMYEEMYSAAKAKDADIVICDFYNYQNGKETIESQKPEKLNSISVLEGISGRSFHKLHGSLCNKLIKSACYTNASFYTDISYCEDVAILFRMLADELSISHISEGLYHYRSDVPGSLVKQYDLSALESDLRLMNHLQTIRTVSIIRYNDCIDSMITAIIFNRAFLLSSYSNTQFKTYFLPYKYCFTKNIVIGHIKRLILNLATEGEYHIALKVYKLLVYVKSVLGAFRSIELHK